jgi:hypothetical protein
MYFWIKYFITLEDFYKIAAFILIAIFICACNVRVPDGKQPHKNQITVNGGLLKQRMYLTNSIKTK